MGHHVWRLRLADGFCSAQFHPEVSHAYRSGQLGLLLADLALPFDGIMQVDTSIFSRIRKSISAVLVTASADASRKSGRSSRNTRDSRMSMSGCVSAAVEQNCGRTGTSYPFNEPDEPKFNRDGTLSPASTGAKVRFEPSVDFQPMTVPGAFACPIPVGVSQPRRSHSQDGLLSTDTEAHINRANKVIRRASISLGSTRTPIFRSASFPARISETRRSEDSENILRRQAAATVMQARTRGMLERVNYKNLMQAVLLIQIKTRGWVRRTGRLRYMVAAATENAETESTVADGAESDMAMPKTKASILRERAATEASGGDV